jgi:transcription termination factor Rho
LQKIWAIRTAISQMEDVEALKFLYAKMLKTSGNAELLSTLNEG